MASEPRPCRSTPTRAVAPKAKHRRRDTFGASICSLSTTTRSREHRAMAGGASCGGSGSEVHVTLLCCCAPTCSTRHATPRHGGGVASRRCSVPRRSSHVAPKPPAACCTLTKINASLPLARPVQRPASHLGVVAVCAATITPRVGPTHTPHRIPPSHPVGPNRRYAPTPSPSLLPPPSPPPSSRGAHVRRPASAPNQWSHAAAARERESAPPASCPGVVLYASHPLDPLSTV